MASISDMTKLNLVKTWLFKSYAEVYDDNGSSVGWEISENKIFRASFSPFLTKVTAK